MFVIFTLLPFINQEHNFFMRDFIQSGGSYKPVNNLVNWD